MSGLDGVRRSDSGSAELIDELETRIGEHGPDFQPSAGHTPEGMTTDTLLRELRRRVRDQQARERNMWPTAGHGRYAK